MPSLDSRITKLEDAFVTHLTESGEIRGDLKWIKKAIWRAIGLWIILTGFVIEEVLRHLLWR